MINIFAESCVLCCNILHTIYVVITVIIFLKSKENIKASIIHLSLPVSLLPPILGWKYNFHGKRKEDIERGK